MSIMKQMTAYFAKHPDAVPSVVAEKFNMSVPSAYVARRKAREQAAAASPAEPTAVPANERQAGGTHYKDMPIQPWAVVDTWPLEQRIGFYRGNALKYTMRAGSKDAMVQDIEKAQHYAQKLSEVLKEAQQ